jgi:ornithine cyclodeaminase/alanine dehydrogenase-like protein (mu-crystallin family)
VVLFHCTGLGVQDAALAATVLALAAAGRTGNTVDF